MVKAKKYYVVWQGHEPGIFDSWSEAQLQVKNFPNAKYKSFKTKSEAENAFFGKSSDFYGKDKTPKAKASQVIQFENEIIQDSISVDAACSGNPGDMEYRGVWTKDSVEIFRMGPFVKGTNNVGEFLALVHALAFIKKQSLRDYVIYSDSKIAMGWVKKKRANTKLKQSAQNKKLFELIDRAENWLRDNNFKSQILKWETKKWGEIPADFGRK